MGGNLSYVQQPALAYNVNQVIGNVQPAQAAAVPVNQGNSEIGNQNTANVAQQQGPLTQQVQNVTQSHGQVANSDQQHLHESNTAQLHSFASNSSVQSYAHGNSTVQKHVNSSNLGLTPQQSSVGGYKAPVASSSGTDYKKNTRLPPGYFPPCSFVKDAF